MIPNDASRAVRFAAWLLTSLLALGLLGACASADDADPRSRSFAVNGTSLTIDTDNATIDLAVGDVEELEITRWFSGDDDQGTWELEGSTLTLDTSCGWLRDCDARYAITVPEDTSVRLEGENTTVDARGFAQPLSIRTQNGAVTVTDTTGDVDLRTDNGSQVVHSSSPANLTSQTDNGSVDISLDEPPTGLDATADNGRVRISLPGETEYDVEVTTDLGHVDNTLRTDPDSPHRIRVETDNGEVTLTSS